MAKITIKSNPAVEAIFDDLDRYREFCVEYGYIYNEAHLYNNKNNIWRQYLRYVDGKAVKNQWRESAKEFEQ